MDEREMVVKRISVHNTRLGGIGGASKRDSGQGTVRGVASLQVAPWGEPREARSWHLGGLMTSAGAVPVVLGATQSMVREGKTAVLEQKGVTPGVEQQGLCWSLFWRGEQEAVGQERRVCIDKGEEELRAWAWVFSCGRVGIAEILCRPL